MSWGWVRVGFGVFRLVCEVLLSCFVWVLGLGIMLMPCSGLAAATRFVSETASPESSSASLFGTEASTEG